MNYTTVLENDLNILHDKHIKLQLKYVLLQNDYQKLLKEKSHRQIILDGEMVELNYAKVDPTLLGYSFIENILSYPFSEKADYETRSYFYNETDEKYYMQYISHIFVSNGIYRKECDDVMREVYYKFI